MYSAVDSILIGSDFLVLVSSLESQNQTGDPDEGQP